MNLQVRILAVKSSRSNAMAVSKAQAFSYTVQKVNRIMEIGMENDLPLISLVQSVFELALIPFMSNKVSMLTLCF